MTSLDARLFGRGVRSERVALLRLRLSFPSSGSRLFGSLHQTPIGDPRRSDAAAPCPRNSSVPSLVQSKIEQALRPVGSGLEQGAELVGEAHFGAPRLLGGEGGVQSRRTDAGPRPRRPSRASPERRSQIFGSLAGLFVGLGPGFARKPGSSWAAGSPLSAPFSSERGTAPCRTHVPCSA